MGDLRNARASGYRNNRSAHGELGLTKNGQGEGEWDGRDTVVYWYCLCS